MLWIGSVVAKNSDTTLWHELLHLFHQFGAFCSKFRAVAKRFQMHPNGKKHTKTCVLGPMVWIGSVRCEKFRLDFMARTFALIAPVWHILQQVSCSRETVPNAPKRKRNAPKHEFRVQWCGSGAFVAKNSDTTSWHELLH